MEEVHESYGAIYRVIREANLSGYVTPGLRGRIYQAIDTLKQFKAPAHHIGIAERISVTLHALEWAALRRDDPRRVADWQSLGRLRNSGFPPLCRGHDAPVSAAAPRRGPSGGDDTRVRVSDLPDFGRDDRVAARLQQPAEQYIQYFDQQYYLAAIS